MERPNAWKTYKKTDLKKVEQTASEYRRFLDNGKTERECAREAVEMLEKAGYTYEKDGALWFRLTDLSAEKELLRPARQTAVFQHLVDDLFHFHDCH